MSEAEKSVSKKITETEANDKLPSTTEVSGTKEKSAEKAIVNEVKEEAKKEVKSESAKESSPDKSDDAEFAGYCARARVISKFTYGNHNESELQELEGAYNCNGSVFIEGVSGVGVTATVISAYLIKQLELPLVAVFTSPLLPAMCSIHGYRATPPFRIYGNSDVCVATGDMPVSASSKSDLLWQIVGAFTDFARRHRCRHIVTVEGFPVKNMLKNELKSIEELLPKQPGVIEIHQDTSGDGSDDDKKAEEKDVFAQVRYITCDETMGRVLKEKGHIPTKTGQIVGLTGAMLSWSFTAPPTDPPLTCILSADPVDIPDQRGALVAVQLLREQFALVDLDTTDLEEETTRLGGKIKKTIEDIKSQIMSQVSGLRSGGPPPSHMYM